MRDYLYIFLLRKIGKIIDLKKNKILSEIISIVLLFTTFLFIGLWHGNSIYFFYYAIAQAVGVCFVSIWGKLLKSFLDPIIYEKYNSNKVIRYLSIFVTMNYVCFSFYFISADTAFKGF